MDASEKPYQLTFDHRHGYLYARVTATTIAVHTAIAYLREVTDKCSELGTERLMIERDIPTMLDHGDLFFVADEFRRMIGPIKVAFVNRYEKNDEAMAFGILVGTNRGALYSPFNNVADAEKWLLDSAASTSVAKNAGSQD